MERIRKVKHIGNGTVLTLWDTYKTDRAGKYILRYSFELRGKELFAGSDFACPPMRSIDSDETVLAVLTFMALRPGDTDREYFADYSEEQLAWANSSECEYMQVDLVNIEAGDRPFLGVFSEE